MSIPISLKVAAILLWFTAIGFGLPCLMAIRNLLAGRGIPFIMGFPAYGRGPFEQYGLQTTIPPSWPDSCSCAPWKGLRAGCCGAARWVGAFSPWP